MPLQEPKYKHNQTLLKVYGSDTNQPKIKVITLNTLRTSGIEDDDEKAVEKGSVNDQKLADNIQRAKSKIFELAFCNPWDWFFTATLNPDKYNRQNLEVFHKDLTQWLTNYGKKYGIKIAYLLIPELHKDGKSWHMHGFLHGLPWSHLHQFKVGDRMGKGIADKVLKGDPVYNWYAYADKFGFCDLEPIRNHEAISKYCTKYMSKDLASSVKELGAHLYYHSRGLQEAVEIKRGVMDDGTITPTWSNEYCKVGWFDYSPELLQRLMDSITDIDYSATRPHIE